MLNTITFFVRREYKIYKDVKIRHIPHILIYPEENNDILQPSSHTVYNSVSNPNEDPYSYSSIRINKDARPNQTQGGFPTETVVKTRRSERKIAGV